MTDQAIKLRRAIELGAQIAKLQAERNAKLEEVTASYSRLIDPLEQRLARIIGGGDVEEQEPVLPDDPNEVLLAALAAGPKTLADLTSALYGASFRDDQKYRGRVSARIHRFKASDQVVEVSRGTYRLASQPTSPSRERPPPPPHRSGATEVTD